MNPGTPQSSSMAVALMVGSSLRASRRAGTDIATNAASLAGLLLERYARTREAHEVLVGTCKLILGDAALGLDLGFRYLADILLDTYTDRAALHQACKYVIETERSPDPRGDVVPPHDDPPCRDVQEPETTSPPQGAEEETPTINPVGYCGRVTCEGCTCRLRKVTAAKPLSKEEQQ